MYTCSPLSWPPPCPFCCAPSQWGQTPLHRAAYRGHAAIVAFLLTVPEVDPLAEDRVVRRGGV